jgi:hypothetical protein
MKKLYTLAAAALLTGTMFGQQIQKKVQFGGNELNNRVRMLKAPHMTGGIVAKSSSAITEGYIDYSYYNVNDLSYVWQFNSNYTSADTSMNYACVALTEFGVFSDYSDQVLDFDYMGQSMYPSNITIDSVFVLMTHENNSGLDNILGLDVIKLNASGAPTTTSQVLNTQRDTVQTSLSSGGEWLGTGASFVYSFAPNYTYNGQTMKVGLNFIYKSTDADTVGVIGSAVDDGNGATTTQSAYATSYMRYPPFINSIAANRNIGYGSPVGTDGWLEVQDWEIWAKVTFDDSNIGTAVNQVNKSKLTVYQNQPNPFSGNTTIRYSLNKDIKDLNFTMYDMTGRVVMNKTENNVLAGDYSLVVNGDQFQKGVYFYSFNMDGVKMSKRLVIE